MVLHGKTQKSPTQAGCLFKISKCSRNFGLWMRLLCRQVTHLLGNPCKIDSVCFCVIKNHVVVAVVGSIAVAEAAICVVAIKVGVVLFCLKVIALSSSCVHCDLKISSSLLAISSNEGRVSGSALQHSSIKILIFGQGMIGSKFFEGRSSSNTTFL